MNEENLVSIQEAKSCFSKLGWALFAMTLCPILIQLLMGMVASVLSVLGLDLLSNPWFLWAASSLPLYVVGVPIFLLLIRSIPAHAQPRSQLPAFRFLVLLLICFPVTYLGNVIGSLLSAALSGGTAQNGIETYITDGGFLALFTTIIVAPVVEEFVFRKQLLDRCGRYGEKTAMVFSALTFGLFHMNFYQFFYAFGVGLILAYVYLRTRSLRYPILIHMIINFLGSAVPLFMMSHGLEVYLLAADLGLAVAGLVVAIINRKNASLSPAPCELPREGRAKTVYGNAGFLVFTLFCAVMFALAL